MVILLLVIGLGGLGLLAALWAVCRRLVPVTARPAPQPPYAGFDLTDTLRVSWEDCPACGRRGGPHEVDDDAALTRCLACGHCRPIPVGEVAS